MGGEDTMTVKKETTTAKEMQTKVPREAGADGLRNSVDVYWCTTDSPWDPGVTVWFVPIIVDRVSY